MVYNRKNERLDCAVLIRFFVHRRFEEVFSDFDVPVLVFGEVLRESVLTSNPSAKNGLQLTIM